MSKPWKLFAGLIHNSTNKHVYAHASSANKKNNTPASSLRPEDYKEHKYYPSFSSSASKKKNRLNANMKNPI
jgi:hypothetical protein